MIATEPASATPRARRTLPRGAVHDLVRLLAHVEQRSATSFVAYGTAFAWRAPLAEPVDRDRLVDELQQTLYARWYLDSGTADHGPQRPADRHVARWRAHGIDALVAAAHSGAERVDGGGDRHATVPVTDRWVVTRTWPSGTIMVGRGAVERVITPGGYTNLVRPGVPPAPGEVVEVLDRIAQRHDETGFWFTTSPKGDPRDPLGRLYFAVTAGSVAPTVHEVTSQLVRFGLPFSMKCPFSPAQFGRVDALVVYIERSSAPTAVRMVADLPDAVLSGLRPVTPPLTRPLARGVAWAHDPGHGMSFGESRCWALADGIVRAAESGDLGGPSGLHHLIDALLDAGVDLERPWMDRPDSSGSGVVVRPTRAPGAHR